MMVLEQPSIPMMRKEIEESTNRSSCGRTVELDHILVRRKHLDSLRPRLQRRLALWQILVVVVVRHDPGQYVVGDLMREKRLEPQVRKPGNQRPPEIMNMARRYASATTRA
jgi:hypothetical protein